MARDYYGSGDKLLLRWRGPHRIVKAFNDYFYKVEDLLTVHLDDIHGCRLTFYLDDAIDARFIMENVLQSEIGMQAARLIGIEYTSNGLKIISAVRALTIPKTLPSR